MKLNRTGSNHKSFSDRTYSLITKATSSNYFFIAILILAFTQAIWFALSFSPGLFDEFKHLGRINVYSNYISPFISEQKEEWDYLSAIPRDPYFFYYYLMSLPLRVARVFTQDPTTQVIVLRLINTVFFTCGLVIFRKALLETKKLSKSIVNISLLLLVLTPATAPLAGAVNYDNAALLSVSLLILFSVRAIVDKKLSSTNLLLIVMMGLLTVIVKWTSVALVIPVFMYLFIYLINKYRSKLIPAIVRSSAEASKLTILMLIPVILLLTFLMIERHAQNIVKYKSPDVSCDQILTVDRCLKHRDYEVYYNVAKNKPENFEPVFINDYFLLFWMPRMINTQVSLLPWSSVKLSPSFPMMKVMYSVFTFSSIVLILVNLKEIMKSKALRFLLVVSVTYSMILIVFLYSTYVEYAIPAAISSRYLIPIFPILVSLALISAKTLFINKKKYLGFLFVLVLVLYSQGGGIITHSLTAQDRLYWNNNKTKNVNDKLRSILNKVVVFDLD